MQSRNQCLQIVKNTLLTIRECYYEWKKTADNDNILKHYDTVVKKINHQLSSLNGNNPDIKLLNDIIIRDCREMPKIS